MTSSQTYHGGYIYFDEKILREYIGEFDPNLSSKGYEIGAGIIMKRFFELENKCECALGIKLQSKYSEFYKGRDPKLFTVEEFQQFIKKYSDQDDPFDVVVSPLPSFRGNLNSAWRLQFKRFGYFQKDKTTEGLINLLAKIVTKYAKAKGFLVLLFDGHKGLKIKDVHMYLKSVDFPFSRVLFINPQKKEGDWIISIGELWPGYGYNDYNADLFASRR